MWIILYHVLVNIIITTHHSNLKDDVFILFRQFLVVVFRDKPLELWDIRTCTLLREMAKNFPAVTALVWTSICHLQCSAMFISSVYVLCLSAMFMSVYMWLYKCICSNSYRIAKHDTIPVRQLSLSPVYLIRLILKLLWGLASRFWSISTIRLLGNNRE